MLDALLALLATGLAVASFARASPATGSPATGPHFGSVDAVSVIFLLSATLALIWRSQAPLPVLVVTGAAFLADQVLGSAPHLLLLAPLIALFTVAASRRLLVSGLAAGAFGLGLVGAAAAQQGPLEDDFVDYLLYVVAAWLLGYGVRLARAHTLLMEGQAVQQAREQLNATRLAVEQEKRRIARELHDIVAHNVVVMVAQAGAANRVFDTHPDKVRSALTSIETTGRDALIEMRRLLAVLWADNGSSDRGPQPGLDQLPSLVSQVERAGLPTEVVVQGNPRSLPAGVELNAYRIVQEALTNALKHAGPTRAKVKLGYQAEVLEVSVHDDGRGSTMEPTSGHGLVGMRQRAAMLGGEVVVGSRPGSGFHVTARLPVTGEQP